MPLCTSLILLMYTLSRSITGLTLGKPMGFRTRPIRFRCGLCGSMLSVMLGRACDDEVATLPCLAQLVPDGFQSGSVYTGPLRMLIYVVFPAPLAAASEIQQYRFAQSPAPCSPFATT